MRILVTGASGFVGQTLSSTLLKRDYVVRAAVRNVSSIVSPKGLDIVKVQGLDANTDWSAAVTDQQVVIHTAALAHIIKGEVSEQMVEYRRVNVDGTYRLAQQAADADVQRFIFISSIGVNGNINTKPFAENDTPNPAGLYAQSKWDAEQSLWKVQRETGMELVIIRPPLVYGSNAPGNFGSLMRWVGRGIPLPLGAVNNKRSFVAIDNLVDLIITCFDHPAAANQVFLAGDGEDLSTTEWLQGVAKAAGVSSRLFPVPTSILMLAAALLGKEAVAQHLLGSLQVDIRKTRDLLGWTPPLSVDQGIRRCFVETLETY